MKSIAIKSGYGLHNISLTEQQMPAIGDYDVVVKVQAVSLNQLDAMIAKGAFKKPLPHVLGSDASGIVQQLGGKVTLFKNGDRVTTHYIQGWQSGDLQPEFLKTRLGVEVPGIFSEYIVIPESYLVAAPPGLTSEESAAIPLAGVTAWEALVNAGQLKAGQTVLIQGTGGVSLFALQFAKALGATVIITSSSDDKLQKAKKLGADAVVNYKTDPLWHEKVLELTDGKGVDLALEMSWADIEKTTEAMAFGGRIAVVGLLGGASAELSVFGVMLKSLTIIGVQAGSKASFEQMNEAIIQHNIKPVIDTVFPLSNVVGAFHYFDGGNHFGKVVLSFKD